MLRLPLLLSLLICGLCYGQHTIPLEILFQEDTPLRIKVREHPEAKKVFHQYRLKVISGSIISTAGVILMNLSLGTISPRKQHQWDVTGAAVGLIGTGLLITKGAKQKRHKAREIVQKNKSVAFEWQPSGLRITF